ncbi:MAG: S-layer homology domain-containing protein, partial [Bacillota bacterium]|nr:S-layer homology domain-containing protein [Bacillota bacterium]
LNGSLSRESGEDTGNFAIKQGTLTSANNTNYSISFVSGAVLAITQATPAIVVTSNKTSGSAIYGDSVTFTATVSGTGGTPKGSVQFKLDGTVIGSETALINGTASLATAKTQLSAGNYSITVQYLPATDEINFKTNTSDPYAIMVNKREITVKADDKTIYIGDAIPVGSTLTYTVSGLVGSDSLKTAPTLSLPADVSTSAVKVYTISITGAAANDNYTVKMVDGKLNVVQHESGLGSSANKPVTPTESNTVAVEVNATVDSQGSATATVNENQLTDAVHKAVESAAQTDGNTAVQVEIKVNAQAEAKSVETNIPKTFLNNTAADSSITGLTITTPIAAINFDSNALGTISGEASGDLKITASKVDTATLSDETQQAVGDRPVFNFSVTSSGNTISQFNGNVSVSVPYKPKAGEDPDSIVIYYITANGSLQIVNNCSYDTGTGMVTFNTRHFSTYAVGYNKVNFKDVAKNAWYSKSVSFIAARGITTGTGNGNYSPNAKLTRGEFLVMMMRAYGIAPDTDLSNNFSDAGSTYYTGYLAAAKRLGIAGGVGNNKFVPDKEITRQEMFTLLYNALKTTGQLPTGNSGKQLSAFSDAGQVTSWAKDAMVLFVQTGTIDGSGGKLSPTITTTRAEMAQVLYNLLTKQ